MKKKIKKKWLLDIIHCLSSEKDDSIAELQFKSYQDMFRFLLQALNLFYNHQNECIYR